MYYAWSHDNGQSFSPNRKIKDHVCECCRIALSFQEDGWPVLVWREVRAGSIRDHAVARFTGSDTFSDIGRVNRDNWKIRGCPHHGPGFDLDADGRYHVVWFSGDGEQGAGVFYASSSNRGTTFTRPFRIGRENTFGHADITAFQDRLYLVWKERTNNGLMGIFLMSSNDAGATWHDQQLITYTTGGSDHPLLVTKEDEVFVSWFTRNEGYRLVRITSL